LIELCGKHGLVIDGTVFPHKEWHKVIWISLDKDKQVGNQIDHICISRNWSKSLLDVWNKRGADIGSDHHMIMGILGIKALKIIRKTINRRRYNLKKLEDMECQKTFKTKLREGASTLRYEAHEGVEERWEKIKTTIQDICGNTLGRENNTRKEWISDSTWKMIERRKQTKGKICATYARTRKGKELEKEYVALSKEIKRSVRRDHRAYADGIANEAQVAANQGNIKGMFNAMRRLTNNVWPTTVPIRDKEGKSITSIEGQIHRWKEYLEKILTTSTTRMEREELANLQTELPLSIRSPSKREIVNAIKAMKNGKAAGADNIPTEVLKLDPYISADILLPPFQVIWQKEKFPKEWKEGIIIKIPKKGDLSQCRNWRGVTLLTVINKIILEQIKNSLEMGLRKEQAGFRHNRSCIDQINTLRVIIEQSVEFQSPVYMLFVDYQRAFDSLSRAWIWDELKARRLPSKSINIIKEGYEDFSCRVLHEGQLSDSVKTSSGVRQGCLLSPLLFLLVTDGVLRRALDGKKRGITWRLQESLEDMEYADDVCLVSHRYEHIQRKLDDLWKESKKAGLEINSSKTEEIRVNTIVNQGLRLNGEDIKR